MDPNSKETSEQQPTPPTYRPKLRAAVEASRTPAGEVVIPVTCLIELSRADGSLFKWELELRDFEAVYGTSRAARLIEDKLVTALAINKENQEDPEDDGTFYITLMTNLVEFYADVVAETEQRNAESLREREKLAEGQSNFFEEFSLVEIDELGVFGPEFQRLSFPDALELLLSGLNNYKTLLVQRADDEVFQNAKEELLDLSLDLLTCCETFLAFAHPVWMGIKRRKAATTPEELERYRQVTRWTVERCPSLIRPAPTAKEEPQDLSRSAARAASV